jgi:ribonuclease VapC
LVIDSSALVAMAQLEHEAMTFRRLINDAPSVSVSTATLLKASLVLREEGGQEFLDEMTSALEVVPFDSRQLAVAREAHHRYGRGSGHPARLDFGDCFSYALAVVTGEPLLFKGTDFGLTDVTPAYVPD